MNDTNNDLFEVFVLRGGIPFYVYQKEIGGEIYECEAYYDKEPGDLVADKSTEKKSDFWNEPHQILGL